MSQNEPTTVAGEDLNKGDIVYLNPSDMMLYKAVPDLKDTFYFVVDSPTPKGHVVESFFPLGTRTVMTTLPEPGKTYLIERHGEQMLALCKEVTKFQAKVEIDDEDPIWIPLSTIGQEVTPEDLPEEPPLLALLVNAQALIERAIVQLVEQGEEKEGT